MIKKPVLDTKRVLKTCIPHTKDHTTLSRDTSKTARRRAVVPRRDVIVYPTDSTMMSLSANAVRARDLDDARVKIISRRLARSRSRAAVARVPRSARWTSDAGGVVT